MAVDAASTPSPTGWSAPTRPVVVVTGGSEGIGLAIARVFASRGRQLLLVARSEPALAAAARDLRARHGVDVDVLVQDLTAADAPAILDACLARLGAHVDILVNNAGTGYCGAFVDMDAARLGALLELNIAAPLQLMRHVLPGMVARRAGGVINVGSLGGHVPGPYQAAYYASKAALVSLSEAVAVEVRRHGVRVTVVSPGPVDTSFHCRMGASGALYLRLIPAASAAGVARWAVLGYELGLSVVFPGFLSTIGALACWIVPHGLLVPIMAVLLQPRAASSQGADEDV